MDGIVGVCRCLGGLVRVGSGAVGLGWVGWVMLMLMLGVMLILILIRSTLSRMAIRVQSCTTFLW
ncbi:hypothetical protein BP00DRAFT_254785 [Aspergillus indologenus CBS 114.80]|uniref:Transmembrane protein n=1 Tax=Aspergillus indologenus CBS 114.80 TaxID=1450541 RepID=A0A2V5HWD5_9EURO|nr:hypothetical protein BP00DRAFT_254785 [Aspergillus indologenus CBS 114.80]